MVKIKIVKYGEGKNDLKVKVPVEDIKKAYCDNCNAVMDVDQDGTCMECQNPIAYPAISFEDTKFENEKK